MMYANSQPSNLYMPTQQNYQNEQLLPNYQMNNPNNMNINPNINQNIPFNNNINMNIPNSNFNINNPVMQPSNQPSQLIYDPMAALAFQYGSTLAQQSSGLISNKIESSGIVNRLKVLFAVNHKYVLRKLKLIIFPFTNKDWSVPLEVDYIKPNSCLNAPDLYLPVMAFVTYLIILSFQLGYKEKFSPEYLSVICSSLLAFDIIEYLFGSIVFYLSGLTTGIVNLNLFAIFGYKYISACLCISLSLFMNIWLWRLMYMYIYLSLVLFMAPTIKANVCKTLGGKKPVILVVVWPIQLVHLTWLCYSF